MDIWGPGRLFQIYGNTIAAANRVSRISQPEFWPMPLRKSQLIEFGGRLGMTVFFGWFGGVLLIRNNSWKYKSLVQINYASWGVDGRLETCAIRSPI